MKRIISIILAIILIGGVLSSLFVSVMAESMYIRKIVSVVYDDSGSMYGDKWAYANYAMQAFCGMLNSDDQLFITYMSHSQDKRNYQPEKIDLSAAGIQNSVDKIRNHSNSGSTPYTAVEIAFDKLKNVNDPNPNTQYWLVVITDGAFDEYNSKSNNQRKSILNQHFNDYTETVMPNGSKPQITFLGIGGVAVPDENLNRGIYSYAASNAKDIANAMSEMADRVSGRTRLQMNDVTKVDDKTIQITSTIPLLNIVVFSQGSKASVVDAICNNEYSIPISREISLNYPGYSGLVGGAYLLGGFENVIASGTYNIMFDRDVDLDDTVILFEPALEMRMSIEANDKAIDDQSELDMLMEGDKLSVSCKIYEMETNKEINPSLLPPNTEFEITVSENDRIVEKTTGEKMQLTDYVLKFAETRIKASVTVEGFNPIEYVLDFTPCEYVPPAIMYTIVPSINSEERNLKTHKLSENEELSVCFTLYADGVAITDPNEVKALNPMISVIPFGNDGDVVFADDGKVLFTPKKSSIDSSNEESVEVEVKCSIENGVSASEKYTVQKSEYSVAASFVNDVKSIKSNHISDNRDLSVCFTVYVDGVAITEPSEVRELSPSISVQPHGNEGDIALTDDGRMLFIPKVSNISSTKENSIDVEVTCKLENGASASEKYTVFRTIYTIVPSFGSDTRSVKIDDVGNNNDLSICFTIYEDGKKIVDPDEVRKLNPVIDIVPYGNSGETIYTDDGLIVFTPKVAGMLSPSEETMDVDVTCTIGDGTAASEKYKLVKAIYQVVPVDTEGRIEKIRLFGNEISVSFYITKDGVQLRKDEIGNDFLVRLNEDYAMLEPKVELSFDGLITVTPHSEGKHDLTFWNWWKNWLYYFKLPDQDVIVSLNHVFGSAENSIKVVEANMKYLILNVIMPLTIEILLATAMFAYIYRYFTKARFAPNGVLYVGSIARNSRNIGTHRLELLEVQLKQYNKFKNLWNPFKELTVSVKGISITAAKGNRIICNELFPWYSDEIKPKLTSAIRLNTPKDIVGYCEKNTEMLIQEIKTISVMDEQNRTISQDDTVYYFVRADIEIVKVGTKQTEVIDSAVVFCYSTM